MKILKSLFYQRRARNGKNIILTGVPRSGTTLVCKLLCELPHTIALNEPLAATYFPNPTAAREAIRTQFAAFRRSLYFNGTAVARTRAGKIVDNAFDETVRDVPRKRVLERTQVTFDKHLQADFTLVMKHCAEFSLILPALRNDYSVFTVIRNPLAILASWRSVQVPVSRGKVAKSSRLNPVFHADLQALPDDLLTRQLFILSWYFEQFSALPQSNVLRYETLMEYPAAALNSIAKVSPGHHFPDLQNKNNNALYARANIAGLAEGLLASEGAYWEFYDKADVETLAHEMLRANEK